MHRLRVAPAARLLLMPTVKNNLRYHGLFSFLMTPTCALAVCPAKTFHSSSPFYSTINRRLYAPHFIKEWFWKVSNFFDPSVYRFKGVGVFLYEELVDTIDYNKFYKEFKMPDTFLSWFVVMELHLWMLMVRCMSEGKRGQTLRNYIVKAMWFDLKERADKLDIDENQVNSKTVKKQLVQLSKQFHASIIAYDEGISADDKILAAAIWRRFLQSECNDPEILEKLVFYVRKQMFLLDQIPWNEILEKRSVVWQGIDLIKSK